MMNTSWILFDTSLQSQDYEDISSGSFIAPLYSLRLKLWWRNEIHFAPSEWLTDPAHSVKGPNSPIAQ